MVVARGEMCVCMCVSVCLNVCECVGVKCQMTFVYMLGEGGKYNLFLRYQ